MNALIALLHFCEVHGPCVVYCTQAIHNNNVAIANPTTAAPTINNNISKTTTTTTTSTLASATNPTATASDPDMTESANSATVNAKSMEETHITPPLKTQPIPISRPVAHHPPQTSSVTSFSTTPSSSMRKNSISSLSAGAPNNTSIAFPSYSSSSNSSSSCSNCAACTAQLPLVNNGQGMTEAKRLVTLDQDDPSIQYIGTTKSPQQPHLYKAVRLACVRSLTAEFCQGRDGPVLFGDDENGYVMSYMFKLRDSQARGEARFYSLIMLMTDRVYLVSCWPFLVSAFRSMASNLQERANLVFQREKESMRHSSITHNSRRAPISSQDQFYRRRSNTALRSLVDLLGIKDIYAQIQAQFSYTLKLSSRKRMEKLTQGRRESPFYTQLKAQYEAKKQSESSRTSQIK
ncbi:vesicle coat protein [Choanephora cucurbitarum]|nr:vesicle coat protein [Choanephora cucurbitarum]